MREHAEQRDLGYDGERTYRLLFESHPQPMWVYDLSSLRFLAANHAAVSVYGYSEGEFKAMTILDIRPEEDIPRLLRNLEDSAQVRLDNAGRWRHRRKDGAIIDVEVVSHSFELEGRRAKLVSVRDVTAQLLAEQALREQARRDPLTGLLNHGAILEELQATIDRAGADGPFAVALADVDGLKQINDTYGHLTGDAALRKAARALLRDAALVGRYGGDEFLVVVDGADAGAGRGFARNVAAALREPALAVPAEGVTIRVGVTIGLAVHPTHGRTVRDLIRRADDEMYRERRSRYARERREAA